MTVALESSRWIAGPSASTYDSSLLSAAVPAVHAVLLIKQLSIGHRPGCHRSQNHHPGYRHSQSPRPGFLRSLNHRRLGFPRPGIAGRSIGRRFAARRASSFHDRKSLRLWSRRVCRLHRLQNRRGGLWQRCGFRQHLRLGEMRQPNCYMDTTPEGRKRKEEGKDESGMGRVYRWLVRAAGTFSWLRSQRHRQGVRGRSVLGCRAHRTEGHPVHRRRCGPERRRLRIVSAGHQGR